MTGTGWITFGTDGREVDQFDVPWGIVVKQRNGRRS